MSQQDSAMRRQAAMSAEKSFSPAAFGILFGASILMIIGGAFHAVQGLAAVLNDNFFVVVNNYAFNLDVTTWGWIHLVIGVIVATAGFGLMFGSTVARLIALLAVVGSALINFFFIPYYPLWAIVTLVVDGAIIWALTFHGDELDTDDEM